MKNILTTNSRINHRNVQELLQICKIYYRQNQNRVTRKLNKKKHVNLTKVHFHTLGGPFPRFSKDLMLTKYSEFDENLLLITKSMT